MKPLISPMTRSEVIELIDCKKIYAQALLIKVEAILEALAKTKEAIDDTNKEPKFSRDKLPSFFTPSLAQLDNVFDQIRFFIIGQISQYESMKIFFELFTKFITYANKAVLNKYSDESKTKQEKYYSKIISLMVAINAILPSATTDEISISGHVAEQLYNIHIFLIAQSPDENPEKYFSLVSLYLEQSLYSPLPGGALSLRQEDNQPGNQCCIL